MHHAAAQQPPTPHRIQPMIRVVPFVADMGIAAVGVAAGSTINDYAALVTAACAGFYLACKGVVLVIREYRKKK